MEKKYFDFSKKKWKICFRPKKMNKNAMDFSYFEPLTVLFTVAGEHATGELAKVLFKWPVALDESTEYREKHAKISQNMVYNTPRQSVRHDSAVNDFFRHDTFTDDIDDRGMNGINDRIVINSSQSCSEQMTGSGGTGTSGTGSGNGQGNGTNGPRISTGLETPPLVKIKNDRDTLNSTNKIDSNSSQNNSQKSRQSINNQKSNKKFDYETEIDSDNVFEYGQNLNLSNGTEQLSNVMNSMSKIGQNYEVDPRLEPRGDQKISQSSNHTLVLNTNKKNFRLSTITDKEKASQSTTFTENNNTPMNHPHLSESNPAWLNDFETKEQELEKESKKLQNFLNHYSEQNTNRRNSYKRFKYLSILNSSSFLSTFYGKAGFRNSSPISSSLGLMQQSIEGKNSSVLSHTDNLSMANSLSGLQGIYTSSNNPLNNSLSHTSLSAANYSCKNAHSKFDYPGLFMDSKESFDHCNQRISEIDQLKNFSDSELANITMSTQMQTKKIVDDENERPYSLYDVKVNGLRFVGCLTSIVKKDSNCYGEGSINDSGSLRSRSGTASGIASGTPGTDQSCRAESAEIPHTIESTQSNPTSDRKRSPSSRSNSSSQKLTNSENEYEPMAKRERLISEIDSVVETEEFISPSRSQVTKSCSPTSKTVTNSQIDPNEMTSSDLEGNEKDHEHEKDQKKHSNWIDNNDKFNICFILKGIAGSGIGKHYQQISKCLSRYINHLEKNFEYLSHELNEIRKVHEEFTSVDYESKPLTAQKVGCNGHMQKNNLNYDLWDRKIGSGSIGSLSTGRFSSIYQSENLRDNKSSLSGNSTAYVKLQPNTHHLHTQNSLPCDKKAELYTTIMKKSDLASALVELFDNLKNTGECDVKLSTQDASQGAQETREGANMTDKINSLALIEKEHTLPLHFSLPHKIFNSCGGEGLGGFFIDPKDICRKFKVVAVGQMSQKISRKKMSGNKNVNSTAFLFLQMILNLQPPPKSRNLNKIHPKPYNPSTPFYSSKANQKPKKNYKNLKESPKKIIKF